MKWKINPLSAIVNTDMEFKSTLANRLDSARGFCLNEN